MMVSYKENPSSVDVNFHLKKMKQLSNDLLIKQNLKQYQDCDYSLEFFYLHKNNTIYGGALVSSAYGMSTIESYWVDKNYKIYCLHLVKKIIEVAKKRHDNYVFAHHGNYTSMAGKILKRMNFRLMGSTSKKYGPNQRHFYILEL